ncbi:hypothetical protein D3C80_876750 [compost metagenome]
MWHAFIRYQQFGWPLGFACQLQEGLQRGDIVELGNAGAAGQQHASDDQVPRLTSGKEGIDVCAAVQRGAVTPPIGRGLILGQPQEAMQAGTATAGFPYGGR